jgi:hypothetical protein
MTAFASLWLPTLVATIAVFVASSILNAALPWHKSDFVRVPDEDAFRRVVRPLGIPRGEYMVPRALDMADMKSPEFMQKFSEGPVMIMTVLPNAWSGMTRPLVQWAIYCLFISALAACVTSSILPEGADSHAIFHYTGIVAFSCYAVGLWQASIWYGRPWKTTLKATVDGLLYAAITGGVFVWLWP